MLQEIKFTKMHGLGNDFVIIDKKDIKEATDLVHLAKSVSHRHTGIGCDQFIIYEKYNEYYQMMIFNQDGSLAKACGNASRCLTKLISLSSAENNKFVLKVSSRRVVTELLPDQSVKVNMGEVNFEAEWIPTKERLLQAIDRYALGVGEVICADIGNPHIIMFTNLSSEDKELIGKSFQECELFPEGINVNFAQVVGNNIYLSVYERGAGFTHACGSGACSSFAAAEKLGFVEKSATVHFANGDLKMNKEGNEIIMTGSADLTAQGTYHYES